MDSGQYQVQAVELTAAVWNQVDAVHLCIDGVSSYFHFVSSEPVLPGFWPEQEARQNPETLHHV